MNFQDMLSKMNPQMISQALQRFSVALTPEQLAQVERAIKTTDKGELNQKLNSLNIKDLKTQLQQNPQLSKQLAQNPELMSKISDIINKK